MGYKTVYKEIEIEIDVDMDDFDDEDIRDEYENRFGVSADDEENWTQIYELRRNGKMDEFLHLIDKVIMDRTGRIL